MIKKDDKVVFRETSSFISWKSLKDFTVNTVKTILFFKDDICNRLQGRYDDLKISYLKKKKSFLKSFGYFPRNKRRF